MKALLVILILFSTNGAFSQENKANIIGKWKVVKCKFYINDNMVRKAYLTDNSGKQDTVMESVDMGEMNERLNIAVKSFLGSFISFLVNDHFSWDVKKIGMQITDKYWTMPANTNKIKVCEWKDKEKLVPLIMGFDIITVEKDKLVLNSSDSGFELCIDLLKIE